MRISYVRIRLVFSVLAIFFAALLAVVLHSPTQALAGGEETISLEMPSSVPTGGAPIRMVFRVHNPSNSTFFFDGYIRVPNDAARTDGSLYVPSTSNSDLYWMDCYRDYGCNLYWRGQLESDGVAELVVETKSGTEAGTYEFVLADFHTTIRGTEVFPLIRSLTLTGPNPTATAQPTSTPTATATMMPTVGPSATQTNTVAPTATPALPVNNRLEWNTETVSLRAENFYIIADGKVYGTQPTNLVVHSDPGSDTYTTLEATWYENDAEMRLNLYFRSYRGLWDIFDVRTYNGRSPGNWIFYPVFGYEHMDISFQAQRVEREGIITLDPIYNVPGRLVFEGLSVMPRFFQPTAVPTHTPTVAATATPIWTSTTTATNTAVPTATALPSATVTPTNVPNPVAVSAYSENNKVIIQGTNLAAAVMVNAEIRFYRGSDTFGFQPINSLATGVVWDYNRIEAPLPPTVDNVKLDVSFWAYTTTWNLYRSNKVALVPPPGPTLKSAYRRPSDGAIVLEGTHVYDGRQTNAQFLYDNGWYAYGAGDATTGSVWSANQAVIPAPPTGHIPLSFSGKVRLFRDGVESNLVPVPAYSPTQPSATPTATATRTNTATATASPTAGGNFSVSARSNTPLGQNIVREADRLGYAGREDSATWYPSRRVVHMSTGHGMYPPVDYWYSDSPQSYRWALEGLLERVTTLLSVPSEELQGNPENIRVAQRLIQAELGTLSTTALSATATPSPSATATRTPSATATLAPTATVTRTLPTSTVVPSPTVLPTVTPTPQIIRILFTPVGENEVQIVSVVDYNLLAACYEYQLEQQSPEAILLPGNTMSAEEFLALVKSLGQPVAAEATSVRI